MLLSDGADRGSAAALDGRPPPPPRRRARLHRSACASRRRRLRHAQPAGRRYAGEFSAASLARGSRPRLPAARLAARAPVCDPLPLGRDPPAKRVSVEGPRRRDVGPASRELRVTGAAPAARPPFHRAPGRAALAVPRRPPFDREHRSPRCCRARPVAAAARRRGSMRARMAAYVTAADPTPRAADDAAGTARVLARRRTARSTRRAWWRRFKEQLDIGRIRCAPVRLARLGRRGTAAGCCWSRSVGGPVVGLLALAVPVGAYCARRAAGSRSSVSCSRDQLPDNLQVDRVRDACRAFVRRRASASWSRTRRSRPGAS